MRVQIPFSAQLIFEYMSDNVIKIVDDIKTRGFDALEDILARKESESLFVEFKTTEHIDYNQVRTLFNRDKNNFAKAISGFGNSEGGIIVWGIEASGRYDDFATTIKPISGVENFKSLLETFISLLTIPAHIKVENFIIKRSDTDNDGVVISVIPKGGDSPYQNVTDYKYYMRAGSSFVPVPHGVLQGMFGRSPHPDVYWNFIIGNNAVPIITGSKSMKWSVGLMAINGGQGIAKDIYGFTRAISPGSKCMILAELTDETNFKYQQAFGFEYSFMSNQDFRLGCHQKTQIIVIHFELLPPFLDNFYLELLIGARNQQVYRKKVEISAEKVAKIYSQCLLKPDTRQIQEICGLTEEIN